MHAHATTSIPTTPIPIIDDDFSPAGPGAGQDRPNPENLKFSRVLLRAGPIEGLQVFGADSPLRVNRQPDIRGEGRTLFLPRRLVAPHGQL